MARLDETRVMFNYDALQLYDNSCQGIICLTARELSMVLSCLRFITWPSRWEGSDGKLLRDTGRDADLETALEFSENLFAKFTEC